MLRVLVRFKPLLISLNPNLLEPEPEDYRQLKNIKRSLNRKSSIHRLDLFLRL